MLTSRMVAVHYFVSVLVCVSYAQSLERFIAAVYEHAVILPDSTQTPVTKQEALELMNRNIDILENATKAAAQQGAHLIVTPEDGIYGWQFSRETISPYLEDIPDPDMNWIPCNDPKRFGPAPVQTRLSCMAKDNSIYVVANMGDKKNCNISEAGCPNDGQFNYNTAVVYDSEGKLVARYHKQHLFLGEIQFNAPKEAEVVSFDTPFGRFGIFICFDILFYDPAVALVVDRNVDTILFPTAWMNVLPHLSAIEFHSAWAMGMGVNLLSSNTHSTSKRMTGSGIFSPENVGPYYYNMDTEDGHLVISELNAHPRNSSTYYSIKWNQHASTIKKYSSGTNVFKGSIFFDLFTFTELKEPEENYTICQNDLCCHLNYKRADYGKKKQNNEIYVLGAFDGLHVVEGQYYLQVCTLLKCLSSDLNTCGESVETASTKFKQFTLSGSFSTNYVFPEVLLNNVNLAPNLFKVMSDGRLVSKPAIATHPLLSVTLFGRLYEKDPVN
ncbi:pantetheinase-like [Pelobates cultripes]|uniref:Pantetheinase-like n=1 Tax=Pelobates cultripes TaxID=61616 RepID=A0AAD1REN3_PELCU|nr:pantetheinase-like [Pelobates cultripes]